MKEERPLFGGAITCQLPPDWRDVSDIRQVPDHQECWLDGEGRLLVVEILEHQSQVSDEQAAQYFFRDLAEANGVTENEQQFFPKHSLAQVQGLPDTAGLCFGSGFQRVAMEREFDVAGNRRQQEFCQIRIELCAIRLLSFGTDILITLSVPNATNPNDGASQTDHIFSEILSTLQIRDWSLFQS